MENVAEPFALAPVDEVHLRKSPLAMVLWQIRFPGEASRLVRALDTRELQSNLAEAYPFAHQQPTFGLVIRPGQPPEQQQGPAVWNLQSSERDWVCTLAGESIGLTTTSYDSRSDFITRSKSLLSAVHDAASPPEVARIGVRYINRLERPNDDPEWMKHLARGARGILAAVPDDERSGVTASLSQVTYRWEDGVVLQARWGLLPKEAITDGSIPPIDEEAWILDVDISREDRITYEVGGLADQISDLAERAYRFFRWVVTPESLIRFEPEVEK